MPHPGTSNQTSLSSNPVCRVPTTWLFVVSSDAWLCIYVCVCKLCGKYISVLETGSWTVENSSPEVGPPTAAPRWLDRPWWLPGGWNAESGSPVAGPSMVAARRLECRERLPGDWTVENSSPEAGLIAAHRRRRPYSTSGPSAAIRKHFQDCRFWSHDVLPILCNCSPTRGAGHVVATSVL